MSYADECTSPLNAFCRYQVVNWEEVFDGNAELKRAFDDVYWNATAAKSE